MRSKPIIISCAFTGARFKPNDSRSEFRATYMPLSPQENIDEAIRTYELGARHLHFHARNPTTGEQFADFSWYRAVCKGVRQHCPGAVISFGSSRKGREVLQAIQERGEMARALGLFARPDYFTNYAAVEITMFEPEQNRSPSDNLHPDNIRVHYRRVTSRMKALGVAQEIELTTNPKSLETLEKTDANPDLGLLSPLNIVILLGFSARLPITKPMYDQVVGRASRLLEGRNGTMTVGSIIRPHQSTKLDPTDVLEWCIEDDRIDIFRTGIEDSPALRGVQKANHELVAHTISYCRKKGVSVLTDSTEVRKAMYLSPARVAVHGTRERATEVVELNRAWLPPHLPTTPTSQQVQVSL